MIDRIRRQRLDWLAAFGSASAGVATAGAEVTTKSVHAWYESLHRPDWTPPKKVFGPIWTGLYVLMSLSGWLVSGALKNHLPLRNPARLAIGAWFAQLALDIAWSGAFFGLRRIGASMYVIGGLWATIVAYMVWAGRVSRFAAWLMAPYLAWVFSRR